MSSLIVLKFSYNVHLVLRHVPKHGPIINIPTRSNILVSPWLVLSAFSHLVGEDNLNKCIQANGNTISLMNKMISNE